MAAADRDREPSDFAGMKIRIRERLRLQLEAEAQKAGHSLNQEVVQRIERTFSEDEKMKSEAALRGGWQTDRLCTEIEKAIRFFGVDCSTEEEPLARSILLGAISQILTERLSGWGGLMGVPTSEARAPEHAVYLPPELEERAKARGAMIGHHITLATRTAETGARDDLAMSMSEHAGETLLQSAIRMGLLGKEETISPETEGPGETSRATRKEPNTKKQAGYKQ